MIEDRSQRAIAAVYLIRYPGKRLRLMAKLPYLFSIED